MRLLPMLAVAVAALTTFSTLAHADSWPNRPVTVVVPGAPGTAADVLGRVVAEQLSDDYGQPFIVENKPGAGGIVAFSHVKRQDPSGHTLMIAVGGISIVSIMHPQSGVDPIKDFTPITQLAITPMIFVANAESPWNTLGDLVNSAKQEPGKFMYGSFGTGSTSHLVGESFKSIADVDIEHIPYKSGTIAAPDVISGRLDLAIIDPLAAVPMIHDGRLKALGVASPSRMPSLPDVMTAAESGVEFSAVGWVGLFGPAGLPEDIAEKVNASANRAMAAPKQLELLASSGSLPVVPAPTVQQWKENFTAYVEEWTKVATEANMGVGQKEQK